MPLKSPINAEPLNSPLARRASDSAQLSAELAASEDRYRSLFLQEQRRARHLSLLNEVQKCALATRDLRPFLPQVTRAISSHFPDCDVTFYMSRALGVGAWQNGDKQQDGEDFARDWRASDWEGDHENYNMVVVASYGKFNLRLPVGDALSLDHVNAEGEISAPDANSALTVPISLEGETIGLISVQSPEHDVLDGRDVAALHTASAIIAAHIQNSRLFRHMSEVNSFNQSLLDSMLHSMMVVDKEGLIQFVNERLLAISDKTRGEVRRQPLETIFGETPAYHHNLRGAVAQVIETGKGQQLHEVHIWTPDGPQIFDLRLFRVYYGGQAETAILLINLTEHWRKTYQLQLTHEIGRLFQESLDIERVLGTVLTCITAGNALGFNRGFVFLLDENGAHLEGRMALGPSSAEEAGQIWGEISQRDLTLEEILNDAQHFSPTSEPTPLQQHTAKLSFRLENLCFPALRRVIENKTATQLKHSELIVSECYTGAPHLTERDCEEGRQIAELFSAYTVAVAPLIAKEQLIGVIFADNLYSNTPIEADDMQLLDTLAQQAALTIDNALTYQALQSAQRELISAERLAVVGEMAARVSHEIRNPLATIGGFGNSILKKAGDEAAVQRKARVIVSEVARLEELLTDLLDMARARPLQRKPESINEITEHALLLAQADIRSYNVQIERAFASDLPMICVDRARLLQALLNTIRNGAQAMDDGGAMQIKTRFISEPAENSLDEPIEWIEIEIADSGSGIPERALKQVFEPFFSTKVSGSGLGLPVTRRIIEDHGGRIDVQSREGEGTTFQFRLPALRAEIGDEDQAHCPTPIQ